MADQILTSRKNAAKATKKPTYCTRCNESGMFCFCDITQQIAQSEQAKALEVKRIKRGTFLFSFGDVGGAK